MKIHEIHFYRASMCIEVFGGEGAGGVLLGDFWKHLGFRRLEVSVSQGNAMI